MANEYIPPEGTKIPFNFSEKGYSAPNSTELLLNFAPPEKFGSLKAAVNVMQPYWYTTHTYVKSCPKYVIGFGQGQVQIIRGRCLYGGIRDLRGLIKCNTQEELDLYAEIIGVTGLESAYLSGVINGWQESNLQGIILTHNPSDLIGILRIMAKGEKDLGAFARGWYDKLLQGFFSGVHLPQDLSALVSVMSRQIGILPANVTAWHVTDLSAFLGGLIGKDLFSSIYPVSPGELTAFLKVYPQKFLCGNIYGWGSLGLGARLNQIFFSNLGAGISGLDDTFLTLSALLKGSGTNQKDLSSYIRSFSWSGLGGIVRATYLGDLVSYLFAISPDNIRATVHGWDFKFLPATLMGMDYPWNLQAEIYPGGSLYVLMAAIYAKEGTNIYNMLPASIKSWKSGNFWATIRGDNTPFLSAFLNSLGGSGDLAAVLRPKMIRLTTVVDVPTMVGSDLFGMINFSCVSTDYKYLGASIYSKYKSDLYAYLRASHYNYKPLLLSAKTGYTDSYLEVDKYKLRITMLPGDFWAQDKYGLNLIVVDDVGSLAAYINGIRVESLLSASIHAEEIPTYTYNRRLKNRERVIHKTYDNVFKSFEIVEMLFKSAVKEYYYSSDGDFVWKGDRFSKWALSVRSILPTDVSLRLRRRLHRITTIFDLRSFSSVDAAVRYAIERVTEYPEGKLAASLVSKGTFNFITGFIFPQYTKEDTDGLEASVTPITPTIVVNESDSFSKI